MRRLLAARTDDDRITNYLYHWSAPVLEFARQKGFDVTDVHGPAVTQKGIVDRIRQLQPSFVFLNGHGNRTTYCGSNNQPVLTEHNATVLNGRVSFIRACDCLSGLAPHVITNPGTAFIGYKSKFWLYTVNEMETRPLQDPAAALILDASNAVPVTLLKGGSAQDALDASARKTEEAIETAAYSADPAIRATLYPLINNLTALAIHGDANATL